MAEDLAALEVAHLDTRASVDAKIGGERKLSYVRGSDTWDPARSRHALAGIGERRTWIKAGRPDLRGIAHALADPDLRVALEPVRTDLPYPVIEGIELAGGFLDGQHLTFCPDLTCLLGGTGAGKSLVLEAVRYVLDQQVDRRQFPAIWEEVCSRLKAALGDTGVVRLQFVSGGKRYKVERVFAVDGSAPPAVSQQVEENWVTVPDSPRSLITIAAFSQGEVLEYSRQPVGRMSLIDGAIDLSGVRQELAEVNGELSASASRLIESRRRVDTLRLTVAKEKDFEAQVGELAALFDTEVVKQQEAWQSEGSALDATAARISEIKLPQLELPEVVRPDGINRNNDLFARLEEQVAAAQASVDESLANLASALGGTSRALTSVRTEWAERFNVFKNELDAKLEEVNPGSSLTSLRGRLESLQAKLLEARASKDELEMKALLELAAAEAERERLLGVLQSLRRSRRELRRARVAELNKKAAGFVKLDVPNEGDCAAFRAALDRLKVGSRIREDVLDCLATRSIRSDSSECC